jgi:hypothetical protein
MPFVAKDKTTGKRIDITKFEKPRFMLKAASCICLLPNTPDVDEFGRPWELSKRAGQTPTQQRYFRIIKSRIIGDR